MKKTKEKNILIFADSYKIGLLKAKKLFETYEKAGIKVLKPIEKHTNCFMFENSDTIIIETTSCAEKRIENHFHNLEINEVYLDVNCSIKVYRQLMSRLLANGSKNMYFF